MQPKTDNFLTTGVNNRKLTHPMSSGIPGNIKQQHTDDDAGENDRESFDLGELFLASEFALEDVVCTSEDARCVFDATCAAHVRITRFDCSFGAVRS